MRASRIAIILLTVLLTLSFSATPGFARDDFVGKWSTAPTDPLRPLGNRQTRVVAEFRLEQNKLKGTLNIGGLGGSIYLFDDGQQAGSTLRFHTSVKDSSGATSTATWIGVMVDDDTMRLCSYLELVGTNLADLLVSPQGTASAPAAAVSRPSPGQARPGAPPAKAVSDLEMSWCRMSIELYRRR